MMQTGRLLALGHGAFGCMPSVTGMCVVQRTRVSKLVHMHAAEPVCRRPCGKGGGERPHTRLCWSGQVD